MGLERVARRAKRFALGAAATSIGAVAGVLAFLATTPVKKSRDLDEARETGVEVRRVAGGMAMPASGSLSVCTTPWTHVMIDGDTSETTPFIMRRLRPGTLELRFVNAAHGIDVTKRVVVKAIEDTKLSFDFSR